MKEPGVVGRRAWAFLAGAACVILSSCTAQTPGVLPEPVARADVPSAKEVLFRGPVVQRVTPDGVSILGKPAEDLIDREVIVTVTPQRGEPVSASGRFDEERDTFVVRVDGLPANTACEYEVSIGGRKVGPFHFITALASDDKSTPFRFAVYGDTRTLPDRHKQVADSILRSRPRFVLVVGDLVTDGQDRPSWDTEFFGPARGMGAYVEMIPCYGNHEADSPYLINLFELPGNGHYFTVDYGYVRMITLDQYTPLEPGSEQYEWLLAELARDWDGWLFCQFHEPPFPSHPGGMLEHKRIEDIFAALAEHGVDVLFCGHHHYYQRTKPIAMTRGQRGVVELICGGGGAPTAEAQAAPYSASVYTGMHHLVVDVTPETLSGKVITPEGRVVDTFVLERGAPQPDLVAVEADLLEKYVAASLEWAVSPTHGKGGGRPGPADFQAKLVLRNPLSQRLR